MTKNIWRYAAISIAFLMLGFWQVGGNILVGQAKAQNTAVPESVNTAYPEIGIGDRGAPMVLEIYFSMTCPHCANFELNYLPEIVEEFVDTGKLRVVYRDFPLDGRAEVMHMLARCGGGGQYVGFVQTLMAQQSLWVGAEDFIGEVFRYGRFAGLSEDEINACFNDNILYQTILEAKNSAATDYGINSTPSFRLNGRVLRDLQSFSDVKTEIQDELLVVESQ